MKNESSFHAAYQAIHDAWRVERQRKYARTFTLTLRRDERDLDFGQMLAALRDAYADFAGAKLPKSVVNERGQNQKSESFAITNGGGRGLFIHIVEIGDAWEDPPVSCEYRCESVGLGDLRFAANIAWLDDYTGKIHGVNSILQFDIATDGDEARLTQAQEIFLRHLRPLGYQPDPT